MEALDLARLQFAATTVYHFFFVPLTLGLVWLVAYFETKYVRTGDEEYKKLTKFWGKLFLINFAMGLVTGIVQEFQFGMNWSDYSRFVGDIFGAPLAIEALLAFFLESTFLGIWIFGWDKLSKKLHCAAIWVVAIGSNLSALWILIANSFMQAPTGFVVENGKAVMTDFWALVTNHHVWLQFPHVIAASLATAGFFVMGISAWHLLRKTHVEFFTKSFKVGAIVGVVATVLVAGIGHAQAQYMVKTQPMKMAAAEALWKSENPASLALFSIFDEEKKEDIFSIRIPGALSFLVYNKFEGEVKGITELQSEMEAKHGPGNYVPSVFLSFWTFRIMVGAGIAMAALAILGLYLSHRNMLLKFRSVLWALFAALLLPYIANSAGWIFTEMGRQPWVVWEVLKTADAVSPNVSFGMVLFSLITFTLLYGALMIVDVWLLARFAKAGPIAENSEQH
jgi:cytochrome d ubiquinol oxidase subunit I